MKRSWKAACGAALLFLGLTMPVLGASVEADGRKLSREEAWIENGMSYMTLRTLEELTGYELSWTGTQARMTGEQMDLTAKPGEVYIEINGRVLYVPDGVQVRDGMMYLPLRVVARATGADLYWDDQEQVAHIRLAQAQPYLSERETLSLAAELTYMHVINGDFERANECAKLCDDYLREDTVTAKRILAAYSAAAGKIEETQALLAQAETLLPNIYIAGQAAFEKVLLERIGK